MIRSSCLAALLLLAACQSGPAPGDNPLAEIDRLSDISANQDAVTIAADPAPAGPGLLGGLFGGLGARVGLGGSAAEMALADVPPATQQPLGGIARTCGLSPRNLGTRIAQASGYALYDTIPNSTAPRPHYITGFADNCARQFSAALATFGDVGTHEVIRYADTRVDLAYSATDQAYEAIKASACRVPFGQPCGARLESLGRNTTFLTAYYSFGGAGQWAEYLLSGGAVVAAAVESP